VIIVVKKELVGDPTLEEVKSNSLIRSMQRCRCCNSPNRLVIDSLIEKDGISSQVISNYIQTKYGEMVPVSSVDNHRKKGHYKWKFGDESRQSVTLWTARELKERDEELAVEKLRLEESEKMKKHLSSVGELIDVEESLMWVISQMKRRIRRLLEKEETEDRVLPEVTKAFKEVTLAAYKLHQIQGEVGGSTSLKETTINKIVINAMSGLDHGKLSPMLKKIGFDPSAEVEKYSDIYYDKDGFEGESED